MDGVCVCVCVCARVCARVCACVCVHVLSVNVQACYISVLCVCNGTCACCIGM